MENSRKTSPDKAATPAHNEPGHVHGPDCAHGHGSAHGEPGHVHGPHCNHDHHHGVQSPIVRAAPKVGRNDPCPCGSGKKYKKCCLAA